MAKTDQKTHREINNYFTIGSILLLLNALFMHLTDGSDDVKFIKFEGKLSIFHNILVNSNLRTDLWYFTIYLSFCFLLYSKFNNQFYRLCFFIVFVRAIYNFLILIKIVPYGAGISDYLGWLILLIFSLFEGVVIRFKK